MTTKEFWKRTGITEGYGEEILKDPEHAAWHMPQGAAFAKEEVVEPVDDDDPTGDAGAGEGEDTGDGADLDEVTEQDGGSVEGETEE